MLSGGSAEPGTVLSFIYTVTFNTVKYRSFNRVWFTRLSFIVFYDLNLGLIIVYVHVAGFNLNKIKSALAVKICVMF